MTRTAYSRVRLVLADGMTEDGGLTALGRSRLWDLATEPSGTQAVIDVTGHPYVIAAALDLLVKAADAGVHLMFEHTDHDKSEPWAAAVRAGGMPRAW